MCYDLFSFMDLDSSISSMVGLLFCLGFLLMGFVSKFRQGVVSLPRSLSVLGAVVAVMATYNVLGLAPFSYIYSSHLFVGMSLGLPFWASFLASSLLGDTVAFASHLVPEGSPMWLSPLLCLIESASELMRPLALVLRLCANMTAGHMLCALCGSFWLSLFMLLPFELGVAFIQAMVFGGLLSIYAQG